MKLRPIGDRVIVKPKAVETKTAGGLIIPESSKEKPLEGVIVAVGKGTKDIKMELNIDDVVLYGKYVGTEVTYEGVEYLVMRQSDILVIL